ncbi:hypothetical protein DESAMIL20_696 [Desulfurella amilsii]|uniref:Uncharacterized protein n=1 Tax=Desulfurella amilsii TaxID=1562698 RepID=A0A1X4XY91_9BACT|nr:ERF family protein [Desulfurella amilsii]OSS42512.1 hypothetical protein DESAMIL20_696 [Desulfurella amilsii]
MSENENGFVDFVKDFIELQKELNKIEFLKNKKGYNYHYTPLEDILPMVVGIATQHNIAILQSFDTNDNNIVVGELILSHISGYERKFVSRIPMANVGSGKDNPTQNVGATVSYLRRYMIMSVFGIATEDNDAETRQLPQQQSKPSQQPQQNKPQPQPQQPAKPLADVETFLKSLNLSYKTQGNMIKILSGYNETSKNKESLVKYGFRYNAQAKAWIMPIQEQEAS